jgi:hypothetical protein
MAAFFAKLPDYFVKLAGKSFLRDGNNAWGEGGGFIHFSRGRADINRIGHEARGRERTIWGFLY